MYVPIAYTTYIHSAEIIRHRVVVFVIASGWIRFCNSFPPAVGVFFSISGGVQRSSGFVVDVEKRPRPHVTRTKQAINYLRSCIRQESAGIFNISGSSISNTGCFSFYARPVWPTCLRGRECCFCLSLRLISRPCFLSLRFMWLPVLVGAYAVLE